MGDAASETPTRRIEGDAPGPAATTIPHPDVLFKESLLRGAMKIGRFQILDHLDEGGMGMIFVARDEELDREVALKILRSRDSDGSGGQARLLREAQALAKLAHPNVVTVYEAGEFDGQVFVAMELVRGQTLREWARAAPRRWPEVIERFIQAGRGLAAAHRAGLVHRDFKPSNVVVGDDERVRVLDFGLALARGEGAPEDPEDPGVTAIDESDASQISRAGPGLLATGLTGADSIAGTPAYMAPELILGGSAGIRSDVFAFSVALYEALCGRRPHAGKTLSERRAELEGAAPPTFPRSSDAPRWLRKIVLRGLAPDPLERYATMDALLGDLARAHQRRRRRQLFAAAFAGVTALTAIEVAHERTPSCEAAAALSDVWTPARRAHLAEVFAGTGISFADDTWTRLEPRLDSYAADWSTARASLCEATRRGARSPQRLELEEACLDRGLASFTALLGLLEAPDVDLLEGAVMAADALPSIAACKRSGSVPFTPRAPATEAELQHLSERLEAAELAERIDRAAEGLVITEAVLPRAEELGDRSLLARAGVAHGRLLADAGRHDEAAKVLRAALWTADVARDDERLAAAMASLVYITAEHLGRYDEALAWREHADAVVARLGPETRAHSRLLWAFGSASYRKNDFEAAIRDLRRAVELDELLFGASDHRILPALIGLGNAHFVAGDAATAASYYARAQAIAEAELGLDHPETSHVLANLGAARASLGDHEGALDLFRRALALDEARLGADHPELASHLANIGITLATQGAHAAAREHLQRSLELEERALGPDHPNLAHALIALGDLMRDEGDLDGSHAAYSRALTITEAATGSRSPLFIATLGDLAEIAERRADTDGALELLERAYALRLEAPLGGPPELTPQLRFQLARVLRSEDPTSRRAADLAEAAARELAAIDDVRFAGELATIAGWRAADAD